MNIDDEINRRIVSVMKNIKLHAYIFKDTGEIVVELSVDPYIDGNYLGELNSIRAIAIVNISELIEDNKYIKPLIEPVKTLEQF